MRLKTFKSPKPPTFQTRYIKASKRGPVLKLCDKQETMTGATSKNNGHVPMPIRWFRWSFGIVRASKTFSGSPWSTRSNILNLHKTLSQKNMNRE